MTETEKAIDILNDAFDFIALRDPFHPILPALRSEADYCESHQELPFPLFIEHIKDAIKEVSGVE